VDFSDTTGGSNPSCSEQQRRGGVVIWLNILKQFLEVQLREWEIREVAVQQLENARGQDEVEKC